MIIRKIPKYHSGDHIVDYFVSYEPRTRKSTDTTKASKKASSISEYSNKDLLKAVSNVNGMPSDVDAISEMVTDFFESGVATSGDTALISMYYTDILGACRKAQFANTEYERAYDAIKSKNAINEYAINDLGQMICVNKETGDFKYMMPEELLESEGYSPMTNSQLLYSRAHDTSMSFQNLPLSIVENGISMDTVNSYIGSVLNNLGTDEKKGPFGFDRDDEVLSAINTYIEAIEQQRGSGQAAVALEQLYNSNLITKSQSSQIANAFNYIYSTLPENMKTLLKMKSDGSEDGAKKLIMTLLASKVDSTIQIDTPTTKVGGAGSGGSGDSTADYNMTIPAMAIRGINGDEKIYEFSFPNSNKEATDSNITMTVKCREYPVGFKNPEQSIGNLNQMLKETGFSGAIDNSKRISFGNVPIESSKLDKFVWKENDPFICAILPCKSDGSVNLEINDVYQKFFKEVGNIDFLSSNLTKEQMEKINNTLQKDEYKDLKELFNADGTPNKNKLCRYMITHVETSNEALDMPYTDFNGKYIIDQTKNNKRKNEITRDIEAVITDVNGRPLDLDKFNRLGIIDDLLGRRFHDNTFEGNIFIPMRKEIATQIIYGNEKLKKSHAYYEEGYMQNYYVPIVNTGPDELENG